MASRAWQGLCVASLMLSSGAVWAVNRSGPTSSTSARRSTCSSSTGAASRTSLHRWRSGTGSELVFYDFADNFCNLLAEKAAAFTKDTGIPVKHVCVEGDAATQQVIAAKQAEQPAPVDVFFGPNGQVRAMTLRRAPSPTSRSSTSCPMPASSTTPRRVARVATSTRCGRAVPPQPDLARLQQCHIKDPPQTIETLFQLAASQGFKVAITNPTEGGSGSGFIESLMLAMAPDCKTTSTTSRSTRRRPRRPPRAAWRR